MFAMRACIVPHGLAGEVVAVEEPAFAIGSLSIFGSSSWAFPDFPTLGAGAEVLREVRQGRKRKGVRHVRLRGLPAGGDELQREGR